MIRPPYYVGAVILFQRNVDSAEQLIALTRDLQQAAKDAGHTRPLFIGIDQENGLVTRIKPPVAAQLPGAMALGASGSVEDAIQVSRATGELLGALGVNMNYAPLCDVNSEPSNPVIGVRSPGDDGIFVSKISSAISQGLRERKTVPCVKHFPGHGDTKVDSHYGLPVITKSREQLESCELVPFRRAVAEKVEAVMTAHIVVPSLDDSNLPASLNKRAMDLLRGELQYDGLIVSDCLEMDAVRSGFGTEKGAAMAIEAGTDCAMICHTLNVQLGALKEVYNAYKSGTIPADQFSKSATRVNELKDRFLKWDNALETRLISSVSTLNIKHKELAANVYRRCVTVVRDEQNALPLSTKSKIVYIYPFEKPVLTGAAGSGEISTQVPCTPPEFIQLLKSHNPHVVEYPFYEGSNLDGETSVEISKADAVILATRNARLAPSQTEIGLKLATLTKKLVVVATCDPYDFMDNPEIKTLVATYEPTPEALRSASRILFGECEPSGVSPVFTTRPQIPIEAFNADRDMDQVIDLWHRLLPQYAVPVDRLKDLLLRSNAKHFSAYSNGNLIGFVATYVNEEGFISALLVDPAHQCRGVGSALISHARRYLRTEANAQAVTIGSSSPRFWPGVPYDIPEQARSFFIHRGFVPASGPSSRDYTTDLATYKPPEKVLDRAAKSGITFMPWKKEHNDECIANQRELFGKNPVWFGAYERLAQADQHSQVMVAIDEFTGNQVGWTLMQEPNFGMSQDLAFQTVLGAKTGQIGCVGVHPDARNKGVGLALIAHAALDLKRRGMERVFIDWVTHVNWYERAGFDVWREYRPMTLKEMVE